MASVAELILQIVGKDDSAAALKGAMGNLDQFESSVKKGSIAVSAAGVGIEALARSQQESSVLVQQNAAALGVSEGEYRKWATSISNAGFPLEEVNKLMEVGRQEGLASEQSLKDYANFWDLVADGTGEAGPALAEAATGLRAVGIAAGNEGEAVAAFGFITDNTKLEVGDFLELLQKKGAELRDFGIDIDDTAAVLGVMEKELGLTGRAAATEFATALDKSDGSMDSLLAELGIAPASFAAMRKEVDSSSGVLARNAEIYNDNITQTQKLQHAMKEFMFTHAGVVQGLSQFAPVMMAAGPAINGVSAAMKLMGPAGTMAAGGLRAVGMALLTPPLGIVVAIAAALVLIYVFRDDIMKAFKAIWEFVGPTVIMLGQTILGAFQSVLDFGRDNWPIIASLIFLPFAPLILLATDAFGIRSALIGAFEAVLGFVTDHWREIAPLISLPFAPLILLATDGFGIRSALLGALDDMISFTGEKLAAVGGFFANLADGPVQWVIDRVWQLINAIRSIPSIPGAGAAGTFLNPVGTAGKVIGGLPGFADGGVVPGPIGRPTLAVVHGGEEVLTPEQRRGAGGGGGFEFNVLGPVTIYGATKDARGTLKDIAFAAAAEMRSRGMWVPA